MASYPVDATHRFVRGTKGGKIRMATVVWYEHTPALGAAAAILAATVLADSIPTILTANLTQPDVPRALLVKGNASTVAGTVLIEGTDTNGIPQSEVLALNGSAAVVGTKAFARVRRITLPPRAAGGNTVSVGTGNALGLWHALNADVRLVTTFDGLPDLGVLTCDPSAVSKNLFTPAGVLDGAKTLRLVYLV
ncbi:MAG: hypothetical protein WCI67_20655 [Chloroflexales bacterium]